MFYTTILKKDVFLFPSLFFIWIAKDGKFSEIIQTPELQWMRAIGNT